MVIIDTNTYASKEDYVKGLTNRARHEFRLIQKRNVGTVYRQAKFEPGQVHEFMRLWERQLVRGKPIEWAYPIGTVADWHEKGSLLLFEAVRDNKVIAMHFIKKEDGFWEAQPPMWDKEHMKENHFGTYMWFNLILWGIDNKLGIINLGGGIDKWREMIKRRKEFTNPKYKWRFISKSVKNNPDLQPDYEIVSRNGKKILYEYV